MPTPLRAYAQLLRLPNVFTAVADPLAGWFFVGGGAPAWNVSLLVAASACLYTAGIVFIQITWNTGRTTEVKKAFYKKVADDIHDKTGIRKEDVWISLVEVNREDWSFGNGVAQYVAQAA